MLTKLHHFEDNIGLDKKDESTLSKHSMFFGAFGNHLGS